MSATRPLHVDYPVALRLAGRSVLLVGGGAVAEQRCTQLVAAGARVRVVATSVTGALGALAASGAIALELRAARAGDVAGHDLAFVATDDAEVSRAVAGEARALGTWVNVADVPDLCDFTLPSVGRRGEVTVAVSTGGAAPAVAALVRRELVGHVSSRHVAAARLSRRVRASEPAGPERQERLRRVARLAAGAPRRARGRADRPRPRPGTVYLVGAGPGAADLLTVRAARLIAEADAIVHDRLVHPGVLALARPGARLVLVGKEGGGPSTPQQDIVDVLLAQARLGRSVVRLKGGDPFVFGRGGEEALALARAGVPFAVVPGVSSGLAAPAAADIPVTHRGISASVTFATVHCASGEPDWSFLAQAPTLVLFMGGRRLGESLAALVAAGRRAGERAAVIEAATWERERVVAGTLEDLAERAQAAGVGSPALVVVGEVVGVREELHALVRSHAGALARTEAGADAAAQPRAAAGGAR